ncbi:MAG: hypothetical protein EBU40_15325 [Proteobacteria bacterium]|nr:hypothetical protein [Pseudomonadota bacterium]
MDTSFHKVVKTECGRARLAELQAKSGSTPSPLSFVYASLSAHLRLMWFPAIAAVRDLAKRWVVAATRSALTPNSNRRSARRVTTEARSDLCHRSDNGATHFHLPVACKREVGTGCATRPNPRGSRRDDDKNICFRPHQRFVDRRCRPRPAGGHRRHPCTWQGGPATRMGP